MSRKEVSDMFPNLLAILDATNWEQLQPQNFLENRLSYSAAWHVDMLMMWTWSLVKC